MVAEIQDLFEAHLTVASLGRAVSFYRDQLGLELASEFAERGVAFFWLGGRGKAMLGLWETGTGPQRLSLHVAFRVAKETVLGSREFLLERGIEPLDLAGVPTAEPQVLAWMPAVAIYFRDPDGNLLEFISMLEQEPRPEWGVVPWSEWVARHAGVA